MSEEEQVMVMLLSHWASGDLRGFYEEDSTIPRGIVDKYHDTIMEIGDEVLERHTLAAAREIMGKGRIEKLLTFQEALEDLRGEKLPSRIIVLLIQLEAWLHDELSGGE